jgi:hypothetical protein
MNIKFLLVVGALLMASPVMAEKFVNLSSNFCLDTDGRAVNGGVVRMWRCESHPNQEWTLSPVGSSGLVQLINRNSRFCLDTDGSGINSAQVRIWKCADHPNQLWEIHDLPTGGSRLQNKASGFCLDTDGRVQNEGLVRMWQCAIHPNQSWKKIADNASVLAAEPAPGGSYLQTCHDIKRYGGIVHATCASEVWGDKSASLDLTRCDNGYTGLSNLNGSLVCEGPLPPGSYLETCRAVFIMDHHLNATCKTKGGRGDYRSNSIEFDRCSEGFRNSNGLLVCGQ